MNKRSAAIWLGATALGAVVISGQALAADLPVKAKPIVAAAFDWSGVYVGVHAGYGGGMKDWEGQTGDFVARGALAGGQIGINKQLGSLVVGVELDAAWADIGGSQSILFGGPLLGVASSQATSSKIDAVATFAGRAGFAADRWLVFAKAGLAALHERHNRDAVVTLPGAFFGTVRADEMRYVPMLGFGAEYALSGNWSIKGEYNYLYAAATRTDASFTTNFGGAVTQATLGMRIEQALHLAKIGVNYKLGNVAVDPAYRPVPPVAGTNWTGGYVGVQGGYAWGNTQWPDTGTLLIQPPTVSHSLDGWLAGGTAGVNVQSGSFVFGVEGEMLATGIRGGRTVPAAGLPLTAAYDNKIDWLALATARAGFVTGSNLLFYGKGGLAIAQESERVVGTLPGTAQENLSARTVHTGVVAGVGGEYAIAPNWSLKLEYDYVRMFGQKSLLSGPLTAANGTMNDLAVYEKIAQDLHLVKFGVNYHFNPVQAVVAKY